MEQHQGWKCVQGFQARVLETRKTVPGLRVLDKWAVLIGGGCNHRIGLYDMVMIKNNHIAAAGSIAKAVQRTRVRLKSWCRSCCAVLQAAMVVLNSCLFGQRLSMQMPPAVKSLVPDRATRGIPSRGLAAMCSACFAGVHAAALPEHPY
jgi:hypothetical protein